MRSLRSLYKMTKIFFPTVIRSWREAYDIQVKRMGPMTNLEKKAGVRRINPMTENEAHQILETTPESSWEEIQQRYEKMFNANDPEKGGSFYIQSKIYRAHEFLAKQYKASGKFSGKPTEKPPTETPNTQQPDASQ